MELAHNAEYRRTAGANEPNQATPHHRPPTARALTEQEASKMMTPIIMTEVLIILVAVYHTNYLLSHASELSTRTFVASGIAWILELGFGLYLWKKGEEINARVVNQRPT